MDGKSRHGGIPEENSNQLCNKSVLKEVLGVTTAKLTKRPAHRSFHLGFSILNAWSKLYPESGTSWWYCGGGLASTGG